MELNSLLYHKEVIALEGTNSFLFQPLATANKRHGKKGEEFWTWNPDNINFIDPAYRSIKGRSHTAYVLDIDISELSKRERTKAINDNCIEFKNLYTMQQKRKIFLKVAAAIANDILKKDNDFLVYFSGEGIYLTRIVPFVTDPINIYHHVLKLLNPHNCQEQEHFTEWHLTNGGGNGGVVDIFKWYPYIEDGEEYYLKVTIDGKMFRPSVNNVFRLPYSRYIKKKVETFICAPVIRSPFIDFERSYERTLKKSCVIEEYEVPEFTGISKAEYEASPDEAAAVAKDREFKNTNKLYPKSERTLGKIIRVYSALTFEQRETIDRMYYLISNPNSDITPPCIYNAYQLTKTGAIAVQRHQMRVVIGRYLRSLQYFRNEEEGYVFTNEDVAHLIIYKINDEKDNLPENQSKLKTNMINYIIPKRKFHNSSAKCSTHQDPNNVYYTCDENDRKRCSRTRAVYDNIKLEINQHEEENVETTKEEFEKYMGTVNKIKDLLQSDKHYIIGKTTRAGLTTSSVIANQYLTESRLVVIVPTTTIAQTTFPEAVKIVEEHNVPQVLGGVFTGNAEGCVILNVQREQHKIQYEDDRVKSNLSRLPFMIKPSCDKCHFNKDIFDIRDGLIIHSEIYDDDIYNLDPAKTEAKDYAKCAKISLTKQVELANVVFITYAKLMALIASHNEENRQLLEALYEFDHFLFDESSHILNLNSHNFILKKVDNGVAKPYVSEITKQITMLKNSLLKEDKDYKNKKLQNPYDLLQVVEQFFNEMVLRLDEGERAIKAENPLDLDQREIVYSLYRTIQKTVQKTNADLIILAKFILTCQTSDWFFDVVADKDNLKLSYQMHSSPDVSMLRYFLQGIMNNNKQILLTDATPSSLSMEKYLSVDFEYEEFGDPRGIDVNSLIITDNVRMSITDITDGRNFSPLIEIHQLIIKLIVEFGDGDLFVLFPNKEIYLEYRKKYGHQEILGDTKMIYFRSKETIGVSSDRRIMLSIGNPLPPADSLRYQAYFMSSFYDDSDVKVVQQRLVNDSANSALFQGIGRVKCPKGAERSVVFLYGIKHNDAKEIINFYSDQYSFSVNDGKDISKQIRIAKYWKKYKKIFTNAIFDMIGLITSLTGGQPIEKIKRRLTSREYNLLTSEEMMEHFKLMEDIHTKSIIPR